MMYIKPYNLTFKYRASKEIPVAYTFSRLYLPYFNKKMNEEIKVFVHLFVKAQLLLIANLKIRSETAASLENSHFKEWPGPGPKTQAQEVMP